MSETKLYVVENQIKLIDIYIYGQQKLVYIYNVYKTVTNHSKI